MSQFISVETICQLFLPKFSKGLFVFIFQVDINEYQPSFPRQKRLYWPYFKNRMVSNPEGFSTKDL